MKKRKTNPKAQNALLLIACIVLFLVLGSLLFLNHKQEAANSSELKKAAQEEIQKEKSDQTWTEDQKTDTSQNSEDQNDANQTGANQNGENQADTNQNDASQNSGDNQENAGEGTQQ